MATTVAPAVAQLLGVFPFMETPSAQDAMLHLIFRKLTAARRQTEQLFAITLTLYRLYFQCGWDAARTYLFVLTGVLIDDDSPAMVVRSPAGGDDVLLDPRTIVGLCEQACGSSFNALHFDADDEEDSQMSGSDFGEDSATASYADDDNCDDDNCDDDNCDNGDDDDDDSASDVCEGLSPAELAAIEAALEDGGV